MIDKYPKLEQVLTAKCEWGGYLIQLVNLQKQKH